MVDLPSIPNAIPNLQAPRSSLSPGQIAAPYQELADNLTKAGEVMQEDVAKPLAKKAGEAAVSEDGKTITQPSFPILGPASAEFARAARFTALARMTPEIENGIAKIRIEHANDPEGYQKAVKSYKDSYLAGDQEKGISPISDPTLKGPVEKTILEHAGAGYRSVLEQTNQTNVTNAKTAITSQITDLSNKMAQSAYSGGVDTPEYQRMQGDLGALYRQMGADPRMGYPKERIDSELSQMISQQRTMALAGQAVRMMDADSPTARADAKKWLIDKVYNDPTLNLTLAQRHQAVTTAMGLMEARSADNKALIDANKATATSLLTQLHTNAPYNPITVNDAIDNARKLGDVESYYKLTFAKGMHDWDSAIRAAPLPQQLAGLRSLDSTQASNQAMQFFTGRGYSREAAAGIVGNLIQESGLNPSMVHDQGTGLGIAGHRLERLDAMKAYAASVGKPVTDFQTQLEFIDKELQTTEAGVGARLKAAKTPQEAAAAFIDYERPQGWTAANPSAGHGFANRVNNAAAVYGGAPAGPQTGAGAAWFNEARVEQVARTREYLKGQAPDIVETTISRLNKTGDVPDSDLKNVSELLRETGRDDLREKLDVALRGHYAVDELNKLPQSVREAWLTQTTPEAAQSNFAFKVQEAIKTGIQATENAMKETPYSTYATRTKALPPAAYDFSKPDTIGATATLRAGQQRAIRANDESGPISVFEGKEGEAFGNLLTNGDPKAAAQALSGLAGLPDDVYQATLAQKPVADAVAGMMGSKDPARMSAAMQAADKLWRASPADAEAALGKSAMTKMQAWQGLQGAFSAPEIAERLNAGDEPSTLKARQAAKDEAEKETSSLSPSDMAYKLGSGWWGIGRLTGSTPSAPFDSIKGGELVNDYRTTYTALRAYGVDASRASDLAVQRLQATWGVSGAAGNQIMKNPPEKFYPTVDGSHDWIKADLRDWVASKRGAQFAGEGAVLEPGVADALPSRNWTIEGLVADRQTQAEIAAGRPPTYQVAIRKPDGNLDLIESRVVFDAKNHIAEAGAKAEQRRQTVDFMRSNQFQAGAPQP
ncbi:MAG: hypothetical protein EPN91_05685 [Salinibacterium sp.]|nr:MAG: hypothetical protein EPN91_05685 [Salinibacterium sp.]